jgi:hypothetical protein
MVTKIRSAEARMREVVKLRTNSLSDELDLLNDQLCWLGFSNVKRGLKIRPGKVNRILRGTTPFFLGQRLLPEKFGTGRKRCQERSIYPPPTAIML